MKGIDMGYAVGATLQFDVKYSCKNLEKYHKDFITEQKEVYSKFGMLLVIISAFI